MLETSVFGLEVTSLNVNPICYVYAFQFMIKRKVETTILGKIVEKIEL